ncbi:Na+/H+ antiporter [Fulvivirgaceae bacterium PWU4]|uniref:Na+/H+ antiporter n=1 Tax=Chryseosolibacter histidini TaxID=2782349 RepID=A0AAP2DFU7_9BACT|nr:Na+/H+ antiporter [Chryseosolibacter histidini]MBT1695570.1 Na+/H+ antiporter [Chryseosolibacter histidini]
MQNIATVIILLAVVTALSQLTDLVKIPYPILLVLTGMGIGFFPGLPVIHLSPETVFLIFLPPILYQAAWTTSWPDFKAAKRPITLLAIGCVIFTTCAVAWVAHTFIPELGWAEAFVLGAIISPPDAVAAAAATKGLSVPKRVTTILEGESLVNDATGLIAYRFALAAVITGTFSVWEASYKFVIVAAGGIFLGLAMGYLFKWIHKITPNNPTADTVLTFITPYIIYLFAENIHISGVLALVSCGLFLSWNSSEIFSQQTRLQAYNTWDTVIFMLNGIIFILIGLQLPEIWGQINNEIAPATLIKYGAIVSVAVIIGRIIWVYPGTFVPRWLSKKIREREPGVNVRLATIVAWAGMRGVVSLAAALAIPLTLDGVNPFPNRDLIIFLTFCVIFSTLVVQGLSLRPLIKLLRIKADDHEQAKEQAIRMRIASAVIEHIEENYSLSLTDEVLNQIKTKYEIRIQRLRKDNTQQKLTEAEIDQLHSIQQELLAAERSQVIALRRQSTISDEILRKLEYELDLEETRLMLERGV